MIGGIAPLWIKVQCKLLGHRWQVTLQPCPDIPCPYKPYCRSCARCGRSEHR